MKYWFLLLFLPGTIFCQDSTIVHKRLSTIKTNEKIKIDGKADEVAWQNAEIATNFVQTAEGKPGEPATEKTEVKVLYSDLGLYIFSSNFHSNPEAIVKELSQRDNFGNVDWFVFKVDSYQSELSGEIFGVTCVGVQYDAKDLPNYEDGNWDGVWQSETSFDDKGWYAEFFIPYSAMRFPSKPIQEWNINFYRSMRDKREVVSWNPVNPIINGEFTQFGTLEGIKDIKTPTRLSITPFIAQSYTFEGKENQGAFNGGLDLKYGLNDAFTLDMTIVPDFSQARSDAQVLNLSPFEVRFNENRAFFTEGTELFEKGNIFYSRRIGQRHFNLNRLDDVEGSFSHIAKPQILNSTKISGRTNKGLGIGFLNSIENRSFADVTYENGDEEQILINPLTNYNIIVADQQLKNASSVSLTNTNVWREGQAYDANVTSATIDLNNKKQTYAVSLSGAFSQQLYEEEGQDNINGHKIRAYGSKSSGKFTGGIGYAQESDTYDPNDLGFLYNNNSRNVFFDIHYNEYKPKKLNRYGLNFWANYNRLYDPNVYTDVSIGSGVFFVTNSRFSYGAWGNVNLLPSDDYFEAREDGRVFNVQNRWNFAPWISTDYRKALTLDLNINQAGYMGTDRTSTWISAESRYRFSDKFKLFLEASYNINKNEPGYVSADETSVGFSQLADTDIVFGTRERNTIENSIGISYIFNNKMALTCNTRHYWSKVNYQSFNNLELNGDLGLTPYTGKTENNELLHDFSYNFFTIDLIYRWRFAPGSDLFFIWKNNIFTEDDGQEKYNDALGRTLKNQSTNTFTVKALYFLDYNDVKTRLDGRKKRRSN